MRKQMMALLMAGAAFTVSSVAIGSVRQHDAVVAALRAEELPSLAHTDPYSRGVDLHAALDPEAAASMEAAGWGPNDLVQRGAVTCDSLTSTIAKGGYTDPVLVLTDAGLLAGSSGQRLCIFWDNLADSYAIYSINNRNGAHFRETKAELLPLVIAAGVDPCQIAYWSPTVSTVQRATHFGDWHDVGTVCEPVIKGYGPKSEARVDEVRAAIDRSRTKAEELFGWSLTWPIRVYLYDTEDRYRDGVLADGRLSAAGVDKRTAGVAITHADYFTVVAIDLSKVEKPEHLATIVAHEFGHVAQSGVLGCTCFLPSWAVEGGADFFASLVEPDSMWLKIRFQLAVEEIHAAKYTPLSRLARNTNYPTLAAYTRGHAAYRYLEHRWGEGVYARLYLENAGGTPDLFLRNMSQLTGLTIDEFDRDMNEWLRTFPSAIPTPTPRATRTPIRR